MQLACHLDNMNVLPVEAYRVKMQVKNKSASTVRATIIRSGDPIKPCGSIESWLS